MLAACVHRCVHAILAMADNAVIRVIGTVERAAAKFAATMRVPLEGRLERVIREG
jgi:hypothetical protein